MFWLVLYGIDVNVLFEEVDPLMLPESSDFFGVAFESNDSKISQNETLLALVLCNVFGVETVEFEEDRELLAYKLLGDKTVLEEDESMPPIPLAEFLFNAPDIDGLLIGSDDEEYLDS